MKEKLLTVNIYEDSDGYAIHSQQIRDKEHDISFKVYSLNEYPEDAIIGRDLFDADDYIRALNKGIALANQGITKVEGSTITDGGDTYYERI